MREEFSERIYISRINYKGEDSRTMRVTAEVRRLAAVALLMSVLIICAAFACGNAVYAADTYAAPQLTKLKYDQRADLSYNATVTWKSKKGAYYEILRKKKGASWKVIGRIKAKGSSSSYTDRKAGKTAWTYSVRRVSSSKSSGKKGKNKGKYDKTGLTGMKAPEVTVKYSNLNAVIKWTKVGKAQKYIIYRKVGENDSFHKIATVAAPAASYKDVYYDSRGNKSINNLLIATYFIDPTVNSIIYSVRPYYEKSTSAAKTGKTNKTGKAKKTKKSVKKSYGACMRDGVMHLEAPTIESLSYSGTLKWGTVPNADGYIIITHSEDSGAWKTVDTVQADKNNNFQSFSIPDFDAGAYYAVRAYSVRNGKTLYSKYDPLFTLRNSAAGVGTKVLFLGNSITCGSPYYGALRGKFTYEHRIQQLTGIKSCNDSVAAATWHYSPNTSRGRLVNTVAAMVSIGEMSECSKGMRRPDSELHTFEDFDVVVLAGGCNDYLDYSGTEMGSRETDWEKIKDKTTQLKFTVNNNTEYSKSYKMDFDYNIETFDGAYNQICRYIEEASIVRVLSGSSPIKVLSIDMLYSNRYRPANEIHNRNETKNRLGYTQLDYQNEMNVLNKAWGKSPVLNVYRYQSQSAGILDGSNCSYRSADNLHLTRYTYGMYGDSISGFMIGNGLFSEMPEGDIDSLMHSDDFIKLLRKYYKTSEFRGRLDDELLSLVKTLINGGDTPDPEPEPDPDTEIDDRSDPDTEAGGNSFEDPAADEGAAAEGSAAEGSGSESSAVTEEESKE